MIYPKPMREMFVHELLVGHREVWTASHGRATRYHVVTDDGTALCRNGAAYNRGVIVLNEDTFVPIGVIEGHMLCRRGGCSAVAEEFLNQSESERKLTSYGHHVTRTAWLER